MPLGVETRDGCYPVVTGAVRATTEVEMGEKIVSDILIFAGMMAVLGCLTGVIITYLKYGVRKAASRDVTTRLDEIVERLARLENSVDAAAVEVERISEGQRFTTKLLADRNGAPAFVDRDRVGAAMPK